MANFIQLLANARMRARDRADYGARGREILGILRRYDYSDGLTPALAVSILQDLGPTFVKIGQMASTHSDILPQEYCDALASLRSSVAPMDAALVRAQVEKYLGADVGELFASFEDEPLGSASIGQVHKAELMDGTVVAVKVRRPGVVDMVTQDFALIERILEVGGLVMGEREAGIDLMTMVTELEKTSKIELDFTNEERNIRRFFANNEGREGVRCPRCYEAYTNEAILTEDFVEGPEVGDEAFVSSLADAERDRLANLLVDNFVVQVLEDGFYHADPHAGNVLLVGDGIEWIDFGMMGTLTSKQRQNLLDLVGAIVRRDSYALKRSVLKVARPRGPIDHGALLDMCEQMCDQYADTDLESFDTGALISQLAENLEREGYDIEPFLTNLGRGLVTLEGTVKALSPRVNIMECMSRHVKFGFDAEGLERALEAFLMKGVQGADDLAGLPTKAVETLDMFQKNQLRMGGDFGVDLKTMHLVNANVRIAVITAVSVSLFLGASVLCLAGSAARDTPLLGIGYVALVIGTLLMAYLLLCVQKRRYVQGFPRVGPTTRPRGAHVPACVRPS